MIGKKIRSRLMMLTLAVLLLALGGSMVVSSRSFNNTFKENTREDLAAYADYLSNLLKDSPDGFDESAFESFAKATQVRISLIDATGTVVYDSDYAISTLDNHAWRKEIQDAMATGSGTAERKSATQNVPVLYHAVRIDGNPQVAVLRVSIKLSEFRDYQQNYRLLFSGGLVLLLAITIGVTFISIRRITRPLEEIHMVAEQYTAGNLSARSAVDSPQELADLSKTMNTMAAQLQSQIADIESKSQQYSTILSSMTEGLLFIDSQLMIVEANPTACALLRNDAEPGGDLKGIRLVQLSGSSELLSACERTLSGGGYQELEISHYGHLFGETAALVGRHGASSLRIAISPVMEHEEVAGLVMTINDVTELKRLEQIRKEFVANVSHELKTPITAIAGFTSALLEGALEDPVATKRFLTIINRQVVQMQHIVEDLLLLSSLEQHNASPVRTWTMASQIVEETLETCRYKSNEKHTSIEVEMKNPLDLQMLVNGMLIIQALSNLVINAITYSEPGSVVRLVVELTEKEAIFQVIDSGYGIPKDALERIFERFYRVDKARSRSQGGTGLGLSIVKHIVQVHGGTVTVKSQEGVGSTFTITLPRSGAELTQLRKRSESLYPEHQ